MAISRRAFLQGSIAGGATLSVFGFDLAPVHAKRDAAPIAHATLRSRRRATARSSAR